MNLPHPLERTLVIRAPRAVVFRFFTDSARFARWWGEGSSIRAEVGGEVRIRYPNGIVALGAVTAVDADRSIAFTYGYESTQPELPAGSSLVTITLDDHPDGTLLQLRHDLPGEQLRDAHVPGWRFQLSQFANVVADEAMAAAADTCDRWFEAWAEADAARRGELLAACTTDDVTMQDRWACLTGRGELSAHIAGTHHHMPGVVMKRNGDVRRCQGTALVEWAASASDGRQLGRGTNVVRFAADGRIAGVVGLHG
ncbi:MAG: SRPBCC domain-containing protein [Planctomycetes bacterium]|nr:SRPBCC domain-containing protein [Planctomycetota bacterium]